MNVRQRILVFGDSGTGKSHGLFTIARAIKPFGHKVYVLDSDNAYEIMRQHQFPDVDNLIIKPVFDLVEWETAIDEVLRDAGPHDFVGVDRVEMLWEEVQNHYVQQVWGKGAGDYFLQKRIEVERAREAAKDKEKKPTFVPFEGDTDWTVVNKIYKQLWLPLVSTRLKAHLYVAAGADKLTRRDVSLDSTLQDEYGGVGYRPLGQKHLRYQVHARLFLHIKSYGKETKFFITTVKDRVGMDKYVTAMPLNNFALQYLMLIAGWEPNA